MRTGAWYEAKVSIIREAIRAYLANPTYSLTLTALCHCEERKRRRNLAKRPVRLLRFARNDSQGCVMIYAVDYNKSKGIISLISRPFISSSLSSFPEKSPACKAARSRLFVHLRIRGTCAKVEIEGADICTK
ncbi:MAG: hypothetical protein DDT27_00745 [Dehalococcoidia bacterium]|nr:hypothetical protein [Chloroflexota bacterium]MBT9162199.1 hypothetical protein [Chloroflexota bacterium]